MVAFDAQGRVTDLCEKPERPPSNYAVTGIYFYDTRASSLAKSLKPSARGELEITDLNRAYLKEGCAARRAAGSRHRVARYGHAQFAARCRGVRAHHRGAPGSEGRLRGGDRLAPGFHRRRPAAEARQAAREERLRRVSDPHRQRGRTAMRARAAAMGRAMKFLQTPIHGVSLDRAARCSATRADFFMETWQCRQIRRAPGSTRRSCRTITPAPSSGRCAACICRSPTPRASSCGCRAAASSTWWSICARSSPSFGAWWGVELSAENHRMLWVPPGLAHGILVTSPSADLLLQVHRHLQSRGRAHARLERPDARHRWPLPAGVAAGAVGQGRARHELRRHREVRMRVLVLGAGGQVGRAVAQTAPAGHEIFAKTRAELDIADARRGRPGVARGQAGLGGECGRLHRGGSRRGRARARRLRSTTRAVGMLADAAAALPAAGSCTCRRISCSTATRAAPTCPSDAPRPVERLRGDQARRGAQACSAAAARASCCAPPGCTPPRGVISCSPCCD